jgi:8-oxo-dGTP diphosphatase
VREIAEEAGLDVVLGPPLGTTDYVVQNGRPKTVHYWAAEVDDAAHGNSRFTTNDEITDLEWLSLKKARAALSYPHDGDILDRFAELYDAGNARTFAIIALRHGKAVPPSAWDGPDATRPLLHRGLEQAANVAPGIAAFGPARLVTSTAARCVATIDPLARRLTLPVKTTSAISQDAHEAGTSRVGAVVAKRIASQQTTVLCSHGPVLPEIIAEVAAHTGTVIDSRLQRAAMLSTGEYSVLHVSRENPDAGIVAVETHGPAIR